jgi:ATP-dependent DNA helicase RecQ
VVGAPAMRTRRPLAVARHLARDRFGFDALLPEQEEALKELLEGRDTLLIMPTGAGKSAVYQLATLVLGGPAIVISPLIALQRDQVESIDEHDLGDAAVINSQMRARDRRGVLADADDLDFLFMAPEQFGSEDLLETLKATEPVLFVVDEAHCISEWGDTFRPDYLRLGAVIEELGHPTVLALTATASPPVRQEIVERLRMRDPALIVSGFDRPNIWLGVERYHDEDVKRRELLARVVDEPKPGIVYAATRKHAEEVAEALRERGIMAAAYHAGLSREERDTAQAAFMANELEVMVATSAFGMGIDKADVRFVHHLDIPESVDLYYQEIGRAGRDDDLARAILFYRSEDLGIHRFFAGGGQIDEEIVETVVHVLRGRHEPIPQAALQAETELSKAKLTTVVSRLEELGDIEMLPAGEVRLVERRARPSTIAGQAIDAEEHRREADNSRIEMMRGYAETSGCRRAYLLSYFAEAYDPPCDECDNCDAGRVSVEDFSQAPFPLNSRVRHATLGEGLVERYERDTVTVLFDDVGYKTLLLDLLQEQGALEPAEG